MGEEGVSSPESSNEMETNESGGAPYPGPSNELSSPLRVQNNSPPAEKQINVPRPKVYPVGSAGPFVVFFRQKCKPLNVIQIAKDLKSYSAVTDIFRVRPGKLRVVLISLTQANDIVRDKRFTLEYRVYIPCSDVEINGVVTEPGLSRDDILTEGVGRFKDPSLSPVTILDCKQLHSPIETGEMKKFVPSDSFRVTFAGSALPDVITIGKIRLPVRLFIPKVMNCFNCKQLGHTAPYCCNKPRCGKCGESHADATCPKLAVKCLYCGDAPHDLSVCPTYKKRAEKIKQSLKERSKRSYAEILRKTMPQTQENYYALLQADQQVSDAPNAGSSWASQGNPRKRKNQSSPPPPQKKLETSQAGMSIFKERAVDRPKQVAPGLLGSTYNQEFPALPGLKTTFSQNTSNQQAHFLRSEEQPQPGLLSFSDLVDNILNAFSITDPLKSIILCLLPALKTFLKDNCAFLAALISFDG